jgi:hypothetical protein
MKVDSNSALGKNAGYVLFFPFPFGLITCWLFHLPVNWHVSSKVFFQSKKLVIFTNLVWDLSENWRSVAILLPDGGTHLASSPARALAPAPPINDPSGWTLITSTPWPHRSHTMSSTHAKWFSSTLSSLVSKLSIRQHPSIPTAKATPWQYVPHRKIISFQKTCDGEKRKGRRISLFWMRSMRPQMPWEKQEPLQFAWTRAELRWTPSPREFFQKGRGWGLRSGKKIPHRSNWCSRR